MSQTPSTVELELEVPTIEPESADMCGSLHAPASTGAAETRQVEGLVLENEFVVATFVPALGGRLLSLVDKSNSVDCFDEARLGFGGLEVTLDGHRRANALGPIRAAVTDHGLRMSEVGARGGIGFEMIASLGEGAEVCLELRFRNRMRYGVPWNPGLLWAGQGWNLTQSAGAVIAQSQIIQAGFGLIDEAARLSHLGSSSATLFEGLRTLPPRWGAVLRFSIVPIAGLEGVRRVTSAAALGMSDVELVLQPRRRLPGAKLVLQTAAGKTMEAPAELSPSASLRYTFEELGGAPSALAILDADRIEVFRFPGNSIPLSPLPAEIEYLDSSPVDLTKWDFEPAYRYWVAHLRTRTAFRSADFGEAHAQAESALLYNGEDHLAWIEKAIAARHLDEVGEDAPELPNAHYLAPLDPLLRAEGFLAHAGLDGRTFLAPLAEHPNELIDVACTYIDLGLFEDGARFIDAALTVAEVPMLRYLYAYVCLATGKMKADAAAAVSGVKLVGPPFPWRPVERTALAELNRSFPGNPILEQFMAIVSP